MLKMLLEIISPGEGRVSWDAASPISQQTAPSAQLQSPLPCQGHRQSWHGDPWVGGYGRQGPLGGGLWQAGPLWPQSRSKLGVFTSRLGAGHRPFLRGLFIPIRAVKG